MNLDQLRELRRQQGARVANASRGKHVRELETYRQLDELVRLNEGRRTPDNDGAARCAAVARTIGAMRQESAA